MYFTVYFLIGLALDISIAECFMFIFYVDIYIVKLQIVVGMQDEKLRKAGFRSIANTSQLNRILHNESLTVDDAHLPHIKIFSSIIEF